MLKQNYILIYKLVGIIGLAGIFYYYQRMYEFFKGVYIIFFTKSVTENFLLRDEDSYISSMSIPDLYARHVKTHQEYRERSAKVALTFEEEEKVVLEKAAEKVNTFFQNMNSPYIDKERISGILWKFALTENNGYEEGLPHTREDVIFITPKLLQLPEAQLVKTLIHERVHIYQRTYLTIFQEVLKTQGYKVWRERHGYPLIRSNPDLDKYIYQSPSGDIMVTVYRNDTPKHIQDTMQPNELKEHPFEEVAYIIADMYKAV